MKSTSEGGTGPRISSKLFPLGATDSGPGAAGRISGGAAWGEMLGELEVPGDSVPPAAEGASVMSGRDGTSLSLLPVLMGFLRLEIDVFEDMHIEKGGTQCRDMPAKAENRRIAAHGPQCSGFFALPSPQAPPLAVQPDLRLHRSSAISARHGFSCPESPAEAWNQCPVRKAAPPPEQTCGNW